MQNSIEGIPKKAMRGNLLFESISTTKLSEGGVIFDKPRQCVSSCWRGEGWLGTACVCSPRPVWPALTTQFWEEESCCWSAAINRELSENCGRACSTRKERVGLQSAVAAAGRLTLLRMFIQ